nr:hypothetical protein [Tanacetum cinerariifolium]
ELACQLVQKNLEEKQLEETQAVKLKAGNEFIKSRVENLVPNPSESEDENGCDVLAGFTTFSNDLFDVDYDSDSSDDQSLSDEDVLEKIYSNPLFDEETIPMEIDQHSFNAKIDETDCHPEKEICLTKRLLYDNSSPRPPKEIISDISNADIESFSPSPIPNEDSDSHIEEIDLSFNPDDPMPPRIEEDDDDSERDIPLLEELLKKTKKRTKSDQNRTKTRSVKNKQENDKIETKPDKNRKCGEAGKSQKQLQWKEEEKLNKTQK